MSDHLFSIFNTTRNSPQSVNIQQNNQNRLNGFHPVKPNTPTPMRAKSAGLTLRKPLNEIGQKQLTKTVPKTTAPSNQHSVGKIRYKKVTDDYEDLWPKKNRINPDDIANILKPTMYLENLKPFKMDSPLPISNPNWEDKLVLDDFLFEDIPVFKPDLLFTDYEIE